MRVGNLASLQLKHLREESSGYHWLYQLLVAFNTGDLDLYDQLCVKYAAELNAQPALVANERKLREKITILSLMEIIFRYNTRTTTSVGLRFCARASFS